MSLINVVKQLKKTDDIDEANSCLKKNWILISTVSDKEKILFILGRLDTSFLLRVGQEHSEDIDG